MPPRPPPTFQLKCILPHPKKYYLLKYRLDTYTLSLKHSKKQQNIKIICYASLLSYCYDSLGKPIDMAYSLSKNVQFFTTVDQSPFYSPFLSFLLSPSLPLSSSFLPINLRNPAKSDLALLLFPPSPHAFLSFFPQCLIAKQVTTFPDLYFISSSFPRISLTK